MDRSYVSMTFTTDNSKKSTINLKNPKSDLNSSDVKELMDKITTTKVFATKAGIFVDKESAKLVTITETPFEFE